MSNLEIAFSETNNDKEFSGFCDITKKRDSYQRSFFSGDCTEFCQDILSDDRPCICFQFNSDKDIYTGNKITHNGKSISKSNLSPQCNTASPERINCRSENDLCYCNCFSQINLVNENIVELSHQRENYSCAKLCLPHSTPSTESCLRIGSKSVGSTHVQFNTANRGRGVKPETCILENSKEYYQTKSHTFAFLSHLDSGEITAIPSIHKNRKKRNRHLSGSSPASTGSSLTSMSELRTTEFERRAPDGGWGWVIVFASFMVHCIADGVTMSFGVLYVEFLSYFQESKSLTSWIGSLFMAIPLLAGPIASLLTDRYGCRAVTIWGSIISCLGFFLSAFADSIPVLLITVGIIAGLGLAVCYVAAIVVVAFYFERYRSLATGIAVAGSGIGTFIFAPIIQYLLECFGWRGCMIILSGIFLNMAVCGALMKDLEWTKRENRQSSTNTSSNSQRCSITQSSDTFGLRDRALSSRTIPSFEELKRLVQSGEITSVSPKNESSNLDIVRSESLVLFPTFLNKAAISKELLPCLTSKANAYEVVSNVYPHLLSRSLSTKFIQTDVTQKEIAKPLNHHENFRREIIGKLNDPKSNTEVSRVKSRIFSDESFEEDCQINDMESDDVPSHCFAKELKHYAGEKATTIEKIKTTDCASSSPNGCEKTAYPKRSLKSSLRPVNHRRLSPSCVEGVTATSSPSASLIDMRVPRKSMTYRGAMLNIHRYRLRASSCPNILRNSIITIAETQNQNSWSSMDYFVAMLNTCVNLHFCMDGPFLLFALSNFILYVFYDTVYMYLTDYALGVGISAEEGANLISAIGILNCLGMVLMGYLGDQPWFSPMFIYKVSMVLCGISVLFMPFIQRYWALAAASATFGLFISANYALTAVILVQLISLEAFSKSYGLLLLIQGMGNLVGPPLVGFIADATGEYLMPFVLSGIFIVVCGMMLSLIPLIKQCSNQQTQNSSRDSVPRSPKRCSPFTKLSIEPVCV